MRTLLHPLFLTGCFTWLAVRILRTVCELPGFINDYLTDIFAIPVIGTMVLTFMRLLIVRNNLYIFPASYVYVMVIYTTLVFEGILPRVANAYTADIFDVLAYALGGALFHVSINKPLNPNTGNNDRGPVSFRSYKKAQEAVSKA